MGDAFYVNTNISIIISFIYYFYMKLLLDQLKPLGFESINQFEAILDSEYLLDLKTNDLWAINDGMEEELIARIDNIEHLKQVIEALGYRN
jgi:hypothetical protein